MKLPDRGAGEVAGCNSGAAWRTLRSLILLSAALCSLLPGALLAAPRSKPVIVPAQSYSGARLVHKANPHGIPLPEPDAIGRYQPFVFPVAIAATANELYVADVGLGAVFRYNLALDVMLPLAGSLVQPQTRLALAADGSLLVAQGGSAPAQLYPRSGRPPQQVRSPMGGVAFDELVGDPVSGRLYGLDRVQQRLEEMLPNGRGNAVFSVGQLPEQPYALTTDGQALYVAGRSCQCVYAVDLFGLRQSQVLANDFTAITAMAANNGWLVIADGGDRNLRIYKDGLLRADSAYGALNLTNPQSLSIVNNMLYVADPAAARIQSFRLWP